MSWDTDLCCLDCRQSVWLSTHGGAGARLAALNESATACFIQAHDSCHVVVWASQDERSDNFTHWTTEALPGLLERYGIKPSEGASARDRQCTVGIVDALTEYVVDRKARPDINGAMVSLADVVGQLTTILGK